VVALGLRFVNCSIHQHSISRGLGETITWTGYTSQIQSKCQPGPQLVILGDYLNLSRYSEKHEHMIL